MLPRYDPAMEAVKKLERAAFELKNLDKKALILKDDDIKGN